MPDTVPRHHIKPPAQFNAENKTVKWKLWRQMFENYMVASNYVTLADAEKRAVILANITPKYYEIFTALKSWYYLRRSNKGVGDLLRRALLEDVRSLQVQEAAAGDWAGRLYVCEHSYLSGTAVQLRRASRRGGQAAAHLGNSRAAHLPGATFDGRHRDFRKCAKAIETTGDEHLRSWGYVTGQQH